MRFLGIDYGAKRIGLALSDKKGKMAFPYSVILNIGKKEVIENIKKICAENFVGKIVLGKSLNYKGEPNPIMAEIEFFKAIIEKETDLPIMYENETLSSVEARRPLDGPRKRPPTLSKKKSPEKERQARMKVDSSAAALILQSYLDRNVI